MSVRAQGPSLARPRAGWRDRRGARRALSLVAAAAVVTGTGVTLWAWAPTAYAATGQGQICTGGSGGTCTLTDTSVADTTWTVPAGVSSATFTVDGAQGGTFSDGPRGGGGGSGAEVVGSVASLTAGASYTLSVGGAGGGQGSGGRNGGGRSIDAGGAGGGGYSAMIAPGGAFDLLAGGGGGGGEGDNSIDARGGNGGTGGFDGGAGANGAGADGSGGGGGGTQTQGGAGTSGSDCVESGGSGGSLSGGGGRDGAGGGGGWYGGGQGGYIYYGVGCSGSGGGGGGGSSHVDASVGSPSFTGGAWSGNGRIVVSYPNPVSAGAGSYSATSGTPLSIAAASGVLAHASGPTTLTASEDTPAGHGTVTLNADGSFDYTANTGFVGDDSFTYRAIDTSGDYAIGTITINVSPPVTETVTFDSQGGSAVAAETVNEGTPAPQPADPTRTGYTFTGWFSTATGGSQYDFTSPVTSSFTLYGQWALIAETVTFDSQGGSAVAAETVNEGTPAPQPADPTRTGYTFTGWFSTATGGSQYDFTSPVTSSFTLYAQWAAWTARVSVTPGTVAQGGTVTVHGSGFTPGEKVRAVLHSTPLALGTWTVDSTGRVTHTATVPAGFAIGAHTVVLTGVTDGRTAQAALTVTAAAASSASTGGSPLASTGTGSSPLASTGTDTAALLSLALMALLSGAVLTVAGTHRRHG